ncbi:MAG: S-layer homology domain-containing protein [Clostridia bacterium]|nr:S-layer homology domain-containing protein [Clostridia bacterium]
MKKIFAGILSAILLFSLLPVLAAEEVEYTWADGWDTGWSAYTTIKGTEAAVTKEDVKSGTYSMKVWNSLEDNTRIWTRVKGLEPGKTYKASAQIKIAGKDLPEKAGAVMRITGNYKDGAGAAIAASERISNTVRRWTKLSVEFVYPADKNRVILCLDTGLVPEGSTVYWDDVEIEGTDLDINGGFEAVTEVKPEVIVVPETSVNLVKNTSFEDNDGVSVTDWKAYKNFGNENPYISLTSERVRTGNTAIKVESSEVGKNPWVSQMIPVSPGVEYVVSVWYYIESLDKELVNSSGAYIKMEPYGDPEHPNETVLDGATASETITEPSAPSDGWKKLVTKVAAGIECNGIAIYARLGGAGVVYFDDMEMYQLTKPSKFSLDTDWGVYYPDYTEGVAKVSPAPGFADENATVSFAFKDGEAILMQKENLPFTGEEVSFVFPTSLMQEMAKTYTVTATLRDAAGAVLEERSRDVYKFERSPYIREDGVYLLNKTTPFYPIIAYHSTGEDAAPVLKEGGINTIQLHFGGNVSGLEKQLAVCEKYNIYAMVCLYFDGKPAAHPDNIAINTDVIEDYKDHPMVLGWMVQDEPFIHGSYDEVIDQLCKSYAFIRRLDPEKPVYTLDNAARTFYETSKYVDILATDPYPTSKHDPATFIATQTANMREAARGNKAICPIVQTYEGGIFPTPDQFRSSLYQGLFEGAQSFGYFAFGDARVVDGKTIPLNETDLWPAILEFMAVDLKDDMAFRVFASKEIPTFNDVRNDDFWYRSWEEDGKLYVVVLNRSNDETKEAEVPLTSFDGTVSVGSFDAKIVSGGEGSYAGDGVLKATLQPCAAQLWEITPQTTVDFSVSVPFTYFDMNGYGWARNAAELMKQKGITYDPVKDKFRPGEKITRGDFAMFLVRTLGLTAQAGENFADVDPEAHYAKDIAIGRAAGILNGVGDNRFNPEAEITRQDLMTITARGMKLTGDVDLSVFSDGTNVSDYALPHVKAMIAEGLVKGNADGTLNPHGNTTRAEAAVIMKRILDK